MIVISNTTPIIGLGRIGRIDLLREIFGQIIVPQAVQAEILAGMHKKDAVMPDIQKADWIKVRPVADQIAVEVLLDELDLGEAETIVLARELNADWVLMDEKKGRRKLSELGLPKIGSVGILLRAHQTGKISNLNAELTFLRQAGFSISQAVIDAALRQVGELD